MKPFQVVTVAFTVTLLSATAVNSTEPARDAEKQRATEWVLLLGGPTYEGRENASAELLRLGLAARSALEQGLRNPDAEIRHRANLVLKSILTVDRKERLARFEEDVDGTGTSTLPGWDDFREHVGADHVVRELFIEMYRAEGELLDAIGGDDVGAAGRLLVARMDCWTKLPIRIVPQFSVQQTPPPFAIIAALLYAAGRPGIEVEDRIFAPLQGLLFMTSFREAYDTGERTAAARWLLARWLLRESPLSDQHRKLAVALNLQSPTGLELGLRILKTAEAETMRRDALIAVGRFGNVDEHLPIVVSYLADDRACYSQNLGHRLAEIQVRDVALAVAVQMTGQDLRNYGFFRVGWGVEGYLHHHTLSLHVPSQRDSVIRKWEQWYASHQIVRKPLP